MAVNNKVFMSWPFIALQAKLVHSIRKILIGYDEHNECCQHEFLGNDLGSYALFLDTFTGSLRTQMEKFSDPTKVSLPNKI